MWQRSGVQGKFRININIQHRFFYQVVPEENTVKVLRIRTHYDGHRYILKAVCA
ncbi:hypothetical protein [Prosthecochloris sp. CIB 2401]|uniref:hypothetical protein n=1 Tax=Prosthecochloris sp. CIB 2401 TaxID=1868325 RepID=UPI0012EABF86|nr:hypothetical protein [Prosthecochloris sp. CIB 2401]